MKFTLDYPPSVNNYWTRTKRGMRLTDEARAYKKAVDWQLKAMRLTKLTGKLKGVFKVYPPDRRRRDLDNVLKALLDATEGIAFDDDYQIHVLVVERCKVVKGGKVEVELTELEAAEI